MMGWIAPIALAALALAAMITLFKAPRRTWEALAAALVFGLAGFALQARPDLPGAPHQAEPAQQRSGAAMVAARQQLDNGGAVASGNLLIMADGYARQGQFRDAAGIALSATREQPGNAQAWLALANSLTAQADGVLTPAGEYAYRRALAADPAAPGPQYFFGLALAESGRLDEAHGLWSGLEKQAPADAPWRMAIAANLMRLEAIMAGQMPPPRGR